MSNRELKVTEIKLRIDPANQFIGLIASRGRRYFEYVHEGGRREVAKFVRDRQGKIWFFNEWTLKWLFVHQPGAWKGFHHGGTLHAVVQATVEWIKAGQATIHPTYFTARHWSYTMDEMSEIAKFGQLIGLVMPFDESN